MCAVRRSPYLQTILAIIVSLVLSLGWGLFVSSIVPTSLSPLDEALSLLGGMALGLTNPRAIDLLFGLRR